MRAVEGEYNASVPNMQFVRAVIESFPEEGVANVEEARVRSCVASQALCRAPFVDASASSIKGLAPKPVTCSSVSSGSDSVPCIVRRCALTSYVRRTGCCWHVVPRFVCGHSTLQAWHADMRVARTEASMQHKLYCLASVP